MENKQTLLERLSKVQTALKAPKSQTNSFGGYKYRNCEDILEAVKPLLSEHGLTLTLNDELVQVGERYYVRADATVFIPGEELASSGYAREEDTKKGMDGSQITGAASSYARKYALNGLFLIDDTKDSDATNDHGKSKGASAPYKPADPPHVSQTTKPALQPMITQEQFAELMNLAKIKGYSDKIKAIQFLNEATGLTGVTTMPAADFEAMKKRVASAGWKKPDATNYLDMDTDAPGVMNQ